MEKETSTDSTPSLCAAHPTEHRWAVLWLGRWEFGELLRCLNTGQAVTLVSGALPDCARILDVCFDWNRNAFGIKVEHPSFAPIQEGQELPWLAPLEIKVEQVKSGGPDTPNWRTAEEMEAERTAVREYLGTGQTAGWPEKAEPCKGEVWTYPDVPPDEGWAFAISPGTSKVDIDRITFSCRPCAWSGKAGDATVQEDSLVACPRCGKAALGIEDVAPPAPKPVNFKEFL